jgi:hypothetical protein
LVAVGDASHCPVEGAGEFINDEDFQGVILFV